jgi:integrase
MSGSGGTIRERESEGRWEGRYYTSDGRRHSAFAKTEKECQRKLRAALTADHGIAPTPQRLTVAAWLQEWLETSVEVRCRPRTVESYRETVSRYIVPAIGSIALAKLQPEDVQRMLRCLEARKDPKPLSPTTVRYAYSVLRIALGRAMKSGKVVRNVATLTDPPAKAHRELNPLTAEQSRDLVAGTAGDPTADPPVPPVRLHASYALAITTGMRQGELLGLRWGDVDLAGGTLTVRSTLRRGTQEVAEPKTERSRRMLHLVRARREEARADLGQVLFQDRDPARVPRRAQALADDRRPDGRVLGQHRRDPVGEGVETGTGRDPDVPRRLPQGEQPVDGVAAHAEPSGDRGLGHPLAMEEPMNLGPVLHLVHSFLPRHEFTLVRGCQSVWSGCSDFDRREVLSFQAASTTRRALSLCLCAQPLRGRSRQWLGAVPAAVGIWTACHRLPLPWRRRAPGSVAARPIRQGASSQPARPPVARSSTGGNRRGATGAELRRP